MNKYTNRTAVLITALAYYAMCHIAHVSAWAPIAKLVTSALYALHTFGL